MGKIPDRGDFKTMGAKERVAYWELSVRESERLGEDLHALVNGDDPLAGVEPLPVR